MRFLGLDYGDKNIGVAVSDALGLTATGVCVIRRKNPADLKESIARIEELVLEYGADKLVLGYPKNMNNTEGPKCAAVNGFKTRLEKRIPGVPVVLQDERMSTMAAERVLIAADMSREKRKGIIDKMAAVYILQGYLDQINTNKKNEEVGKLSDMNEEFDEEELDEEMYETITMTTDDGEEIEFIVSDTVEVDGAVYIVVFEADADPDDDDQDAYIFKQVGEDGDEYLYEEVSEEEFNKVAQKLAEMSDEYDIEDME